ncbi:hypothetical protein VTJ49DRAFT_2031 [Mycothermus thermophilus]|uniref:Uncharacterized protein n=1 Tax=Humicola insolens TaxID=85995 RepID=A0ABR3VAU1_HUMIN
MAGQGGGDGPTPWAWFPIGKQDLPGWRFDVITLLAIIGESSVAGHAQTLTASSLCLLPRIIPAPQALLRPSRPQRLPEVTAKMAGVYNGVVLDSVGFFANIMHPLDQFKPFAFKVLEIKHAARPLVSERVMKRGPGEGRRERWLAGLKGGFGVLGRRMGDVKDVVVEAVGVRKRRGSAASAARENNTVVHFADVEQGRREQAASPPPDATSPTSPSNNNNNPPSPPPTPTPPKRTPTISERITDMVTYPTMVNTEECYTVPPRFGSPVHVLSVFSFLLTVAIIACAVYWRDGTAIVAIALMSLAGTVVCFASWWRPILMHRRTTNRVPRGDVVIRTREGAFVLVKCTEEVARELYSGTEECRYVVGSQSHRALMGLGMVLLMVSVVLLGNCSWESQALIGGSYILLNGLYWLMSLLPARRFWDLSRYEIIDRTPADAKRAHEKTSADVREGEPSFTRTLWYAVRETKHGAWVERSGAMPGTDQWRKWLAEALREAKRGHNDWPAVSRKNEIMREAADAYAQDEMEKGCDDEARQRAPLMEVQPIRRTDTSHSTF